MQQGYTSELAERNASTYAAFLMPHLRPGMRLVDCGCGPGTITVGIAEKLAPSEVVGVDVSESIFEPSRTFAAEQGISNLSFTVGDIYGLPFSEEEFDAAFVHSVMEALDSPDDALREVKRVLKPGGLIGVASVEYGGVIIGGPSSDLLEQYYVIREESWKRQRVGKPRFGRNLRGLLHRAGFTGIRESANYISYGEPDAVRGFGDDRVREIAEKGSDFIGYGIADRETLVEMAEAWKKWGSSPAAFFAFSWCNAVGWKS